MNKGCTQEPVRFPDILDQARDVHERWLSAMRAGDFELAWQQTDRIELPRRRRAAAGRPKPGELRWDGTPFKGKRVLIRCLHGLGDTLQFVRFVPLVRQQASHVTLAIQPQLQPLFPPEGEFGSVCNGWSDDHFAGHEVEIEIMELAYAFRVREDTLPRATPYLDLDWIRKQSTWRAPSNDSRPRVGLVWKSSDWDASRSVYPPALAPLKADETLLYSLQQDVSSSELQTLPIQPHSLSEYTRRIVDAANAMLWLDLIISIDGMAAHLAGALGRPAWVLLKKDADWRWMSHRAETPWYPSMRLFRQEKEGDWYGVLRTAAGELSAMDRSHYQSHSRTRPSSRAACANINS